MKKNSRVYIHLGLLIFFFVKTIDGMAQYFTITCDTLNFSFNRAPVILRYNNFIKDFDLSGLPWTQDDMKSNGKGFESRVQVKSPTFITLYNAQLLAIPNQSIKGTLTGSGVNFITNDTNNINRYLLEIDSATMQIAIQYNKSTQFKTFLNLYDSLYYYIDSTTKYLNSYAAKKKYHLTEDVKSAIIQFCTAKLANFSLLPFLYEGKYDSEKIFSLIKKDIKIKDAKYWLQYQYARIFLRTYFFDILLPRSKSNYQNILNTEPLFKDIDIKKYLEYQYFNAVSNSDTALNNVSETIKNIDAYQKKYYFSAIEKKSIQLLRDKFDLPGKNVAILFGKQHLGNYKGASLESEKNTLLLNQGKVIVYYWATWCIPCIETIRKLQSNEFVYKAKKYKILFVSVDENFNKWKNYKSSVLQEKNSFVLKDFKSPSFYKTFQIAAIPRLFLIDNGILIDQNFSKQKLEEMILQ